MLYYDIPKTIFNQYLLDKETHDTYCEEGYIVSYNKFTLAPKEDKCPYCLKFNKDVYNDQ